MMKVHWYSPLPPERTDIANYSARVCEPLSSLCDLTAYAPKIDGAAQLPFASERIANIKLSDINQADMAIYQIGNDARYHGMILDHALRHPGIVVLHDMAILELIFESRKRGMLTIPDLEREFVASLAADHGEVGFLTGLGLMCARLDPSRASARFPAYRFVLENSLGVVVHNEQVAAHLAESLPDLPQLCLPLPYLSMEGKTLPERSERSWPATPQEPVKLVMFGFIGANRRLPQILQALARQPNRGCFRLDVAGEVHDAKNVQALIKELGLTKTVRLHGFLPEQRLDNLIADADMALNLRYPTMGEASGSMLRIWANGTPGVVTDVGWYRTLPDNTVVKIRHDSEAGDLNRLFESLSWGGLRSRGSEIRMNAWNRLIEHSPENYASALSSWLLEHAVTVKLKWFLRNVNRKKFMMMSEIRQLG